MCERRILTPPATHSNSLHVWPWYWISEANGRMLKTKSSHITSMYDNLYHKFFLFRRNSKIRGFFVTSDQRRISQLPISALSFGKKPIISKLFARFLITGLLETVVIQGNYLSPSCDTFRSYIHSVILGIDGKKTKFLGQAELGKVGLYKKKKKHLETNFANFFILQLRWRCSLVGPWKVCGVSVLCLRCSPPRATNSHTSRKASPLHAGICDITKTTGSTQGCYRVRRMHRGKGMSFDPNQWQKSRPGKRVCNERIISMLMV